MSSASKLYEAAFGGAIATGMDERTATALADAVGLIPNVVSLLALEEGNSAVKRLVRAIAKNQKGGANEGIDPPDDEGNAGDVSSAPIAPIPQPMNASMPRDWLSDTLSSRTGVFIVMLASFLFMEFARRQLFQADGIDMAALPPILRGPYTESAEQLSRAMQLDPASSPRAQEILEQFGSSMSSGPFGLWRPVASEESLNTLRESVREAIEAVPSQHGNLSIIAEWMGNFMTEHISNVLVALTGGALTAYATSRMALTQGRQPAQSDQAAVQPPAAQQRPRRRGGGKSRRQKASRPRRAKTKARKARKSKKTRRI